MLSKWRGTGLTNPSLDFLGENRWAGRFRFSLFKLRWLTWSADERGEILAQTEGMLCGQMFDNDEQRVAWFSHSPIPMNWADIMVFLETNWNFWNDRTP